MLKKCDGECCDSLCCPAGTMCCTSSDPCLPAGFRECTESVGGIAIACVCAPCLFANDPREEANDAVQGWINATGQTDSCRIDAMQHCVGAALVAYDCGWMCALCAGDLQELWQGDWDPMDYANNEAGVQCPSATSDLFQSK